MNIVSQIRAYSLLSAVFTDREADPFCRFCTAFAAALVSVRESMAKFEQAHTSDLEQLPDGFSLYYWVAKSKLCGVRTTGSSKPQKKTGACTLPDGVCFLKYSLTLLRSAQGGPNPV